MADIADRDLTIETSWLSLWEPLIEEAARLCVFSAESPNREMAAAAAAIVLARTGWEAFANKFIEQRDLTPRLKNAPVREKLEGIFHELGGSTSLWEGRKVWSDLLLVNEMRNFIAHQKNLRAAEPTHQSACLTLSRRSA
jgi:hypothetical protein